MKGDVTVEKGKKAIKLSEEQLSQVTGGQDAYSKDCGRYIVYFTTQNDGNGPVYVRDTVDNLVYIFLTKQEYEAWADENDILL